MFEPLSSNVPPVAASYQSIAEPAGGVAEIVTVPVPHVAPLVEVAGTAGAGLTVAVTTNLVADTQPVDKFLTSA